MTLVEVLIFSVLALFILGSSFPVISQVLFADRAHEERLAAATYLQSSRERLKLASKNTLTNGFSIASGGTNLERTIIVDNFYKNRSATNITTLIPKSEEEFGRYYEALLQLVWTSELASGKTKTHTADLTVIIPKFDL